nr:MAG TPA: hypothetical protein [Caudoviricetes sp.]
MLISISRPVRTIQKHLYFLAFSTLYGKIKVS